MCTQQREREPGRDDETGDAGQADGDAGWQALDQLIDEYAMETGIHDLAHQHDHYIHGTPKQDA